MKYTPTNNWSNCPYWEQCTDEKKHIMTYCDVQCSNPTKKKELDRPQYTKGEWKHTEDGVIVASDGKQIASVFPRDREANARLIAQAPRLYEACKYLLTLDWGIAEKSKIDKALVAIALVEGK